MEDLIRGHRRFLSDVQPEKQELFTKLASGQSPATLLVTCSDSRVVPSLFTQSEPGDLFVIRNAGNLVPPHGAIAGGEQATVEYAVAVLGVEHVVVCGHADCGAMKGLLAPESLQELPEVAEWLKLARPTQLVAQAQCAGASKDELLARAIEINAVQQLHNLRTHPSVAKAVARGSLSLHAWVYDIGSGAVRSYDDDAEAFRPLAEA